MLTFILSLFFVLHGLVHLLYFGQSRRLFELHPGLTWPGRSWIFSGFPGIKTMRIIACITCILTATGFITGSYAILIDQGWWKPVIIASAALSSLMFILLWDGQKKNLSYKGGIGLLINAVIFITVILFH